MTTVQPQKKQSFSQKGRWKYSERGTGLGAAALSARISR